MRQIKEHQLDSPRLNQVEADLSDVMLEVEAARGDEATLKDYIDAAGGAIKSYAEYTPAPASTTLEIAEMLEPGDKLLLFYNGILLTSGAGNDYTVGGITITLSFATIALDRFTAVVTGIGSGSGGGGGSGFWRNPVVDLVDLPLIEIDNVDGEVRLVLAEDKAYRWESLTSSWIAISGGGGGGTTDAEVIAARAAYDELGDRLDAMEAVSTAVVAEITEARGGHVALTDRLDVIEMSSGSTSHTETFSDLDEVDTGLTTAVVGSGILQAGRGFKITDPFDDSAQVDVIGSSVGIVVDHILGEVRTNRAVLSATLLSNNATVYPSDRYTLVTTDSHESELGPEAQQTQAITSAGIETATQTDSYGNFWVFNRTANATWSINVYSKAGALLASRASAATGPNGTYAAAGMKVCAGVDGSMWMAAVQATIGATTKSIIAAHWSGYAAVTAGAKSAVQVQSYAQSTSRNDYTVLGLAEDSMGRLWMAYEYTTGAAFYYRVIDSSMATIIAQTTQSLAAYASTPTRTLFPQPFMLSNGEMAIACSVYQTGAGWSEAIGLILKYNMSGVVVGDVLNWYTGLNIQTSNVEIGVTSLFEKDERLHLYHNNKGGTLHNIIDIGTWVVELPVSGTDVYTPTAFTIGTSTIASTTTRYGYHFVMTQDMVLLGAHAWVGNTLGSIASPGLGVMEKVGATWLDRGSSLITTVGATTQAICYAPSPTTRWRYHLQAGREYLIYLMPLLSTLGLRSHGAPGALIEESWGTYRPASSDSPFSSVASLDSQLICRFYLTSAAYVEKGNAFNESVGSVRSITSYTGIGDPLLLYKTSNESTSPGIWGTTQQMMVGRMTGANLHEIGDKVPVDIAETSPNWPSIWRYDADEWVVSYINNDTLTTLRWNNLSVLPTSIAYSVTNNDGVGWTAITPDGTPVTIAGGTSSQVRLRAIFSSQRMDSTSHLQEYVLTGWDQADTGAMTQTYYSLSLPSALPTARGTISPIADDNDGSIIYYLSNDGGLNWTEATPGQPVMFDNWGAADVRVKIQITIDELGTVSPTVDEYTLITSDLAPALAVAERMKAREIEHLKLRLEVDTLTGSSKHALTTTVTDTFNDGTGIDPGPSSNYAIDNILKLAQASGGTGTLISTADTAAVAPTAIFFTAQETLNTGTITYSVSRNDGVTWTAAIVDDAVQVSGQPTGTQIRVRAIITADAQLLGWGWGWY
jgi:hypothetical protein